jgi:hypothetical protein
VLERVLDELGLVLEGGYLTLYFPAMGSAVVFRVKSRVNRGYEVIDYGSLPIKAGTSLPTYEGTSTTVPADGVLPARSYTRDGLQFPPIVSGTFSSTDMWHTPEDDRDTLYHVKLHVHPPVIRVDLQIPTRIQQGRFQRGRVIVGVDTDFGFKRGFIEAVHFPYIQYGYRFGNDTNLDLKTFAKFTYGEYVVEVPRSAELIFDILTRRVLSYWLTMPVNYVDPAITDMFKRVYGFPVREGAVQLFKLYGIDERDKAIREYLEVLRALRR